MTQPVIQPAQDIASSSGKIASEGLGTSPPDEAAPFGLYIKTYGCQMNVYDSERMADILAPMGFRLQESAEGADMVVLNTCHIREKAAEKLYSDLGRLGRMQRVRDPNMPILAVAGCVAQAEGEEVIRRAPGVDIVIGPQVYHELPEMVDQLLKARNGAKRERLVNTEFPEIPKFDHLPIARTPTGPSAFLSIQEGCDKFCSFCVVPYTRGAEYSRPAASILAEAKSLLEGGARELVLLGQNVNAWDGDWSEVDTALTAGSKQVKNGFARLLHALNALGAMITPTQTTAAGHTLGNDSAALARLRYTTSHPRDMSPDLIEAHGCLETLVPSLHLPVQSGADAVLKAMNRKHSRADYLDIIEQLKAVAPGIALTSDFIVGFPSETDADFEDTLSLVEEVGYSAAYSFKYSRRPGTPGARAQGQIREEVKSERLALLQERLMSLSHRFNAHFVGQIVEVLLERPGRGPSHQLVGKTQHNISVPVDIPDPINGPQIGDLVRVEITASSAHSLTGQLIA